MRASTAFFTLLLVLTGLLGCSGGSTDVPSAEAEETPGAAGDRAVAALPSSASAEERARARLDAEYPRYAAVTGTLITVRTEADESAAIVGWLRAGSQVRVDDEARRGPGCREWRRIHPTGWVCDDDSLEVRESEIEIEAPTLTGWEEDQVEQAQARGALVLPTTARDAPMPYDYWYVRENTVPEYHRLPSRNEQRAALARVGNTKRGAGSRGGRRGVSRCPRTGTA